MIRTPVTSIYLSSSRQTFRASVPLTLRGFSNYRIVTRYRRRAGSADRIGIPSADACAQHHAVEGGAVERWKRFQFAEVGRADREHLDAVLFHLPEEVAGGRAGSISLHSWFELSRYIARRSAERRRFVRDRPQKDVGVDQDFHFSNTARMSTGSGSLRSSGTTKSPLAVPSCR